LVAIFNNKIQQQDHKHVLPGIQRRVDCRVPTELDSELQNGSEFSINVHINFVSVLIKKKADCTAVTNMQQQRSATVPDLVFNVGLIVTCVRNYRILL
jgi:hypothetical protein